jgi:hypothetical protein
MNFLVRPYGEGLNPSYLAIQALPFGFLIYWLRRVNKRVSQVLFGLVAFFLMSSDLSGQSYLEKKTRHRFAQSYLGLFTQWQSPDQAVLAGLSIGGLHFWGHADFSLDIPLWRNNKEGLQPQIATRFKYFPWPITRQKVRPYLGLAWQPTAYRRFNGPALTQHRFPALAGLTYQSGAWLIELNGAWQRAREFEYPISANQYAIFKPGALQLGLSLKYSFDFTASAETNWENGRTAFYTDTLGKLGRLDSWTIGLGVSSAFFGESYPVSLNALHLSDPERSQLLPDFSLGYYWHQLDLQLQLIYRYFKSERRAYGESLIYQRHSLALETYMFLADYHGFVPFLGAGVGPNWLHRSRKSTISLNENTEAWLPHLTLGWDIRPNRLQSFYLRTHLRYTFADRSLRRQQWAIANFEINFIQLVVLLDRW